MSKTSEGLPDAKNNPENNPETLSVLGKLGRVAAKAAGAVRGIVRTATNRNRFAKRLGINTEKATGVDVDSAAVEGVLSSDSSAGDSEKDSREGSSNGLTPKEIKALEKYARVVVIPTPEEQTSDSTEDASGSSAKKNIPVSEPPEPTPDELARIKGKDEMRDAAAKRSVLVRPTTEEDLRELGSFGVNIDLNSVKPSTPEKPVDVSEKNDRKDDANSTKDNQGAGAVEPGKDEKVKDSNSDTGEAPVKEISPEEHELATNLKVARIRYVNAGVKYETHYFKENFGGEERRKKLDAAAEELKRCELEYMRFQFSEKIEAVKQGSEEDQAKLAEEIAHAVFEDMQRVSREIKEAYNEKLDSQSPIRKVLSKLGKWINKGGKISQTVKQGGAGLVGGAIVGSVATWPITTAVGLAAGVGVVNLAKLGALEDRRDKDILSEIPIERLGKLFRADVKGMDVGNVIDHTVSGSIGELHNASVERQDDLRKRMSWAMGRFSVGFALGGYAGKFVGDWANSAHATGDSASQSGGKELKTHLFEKVKNTAPGAADPVDNYTPGLDSLYGYDPSKHEFLWQWAESVYGEGNGTSGIMHTVDVLRDNGYIVDIINNPNGSFSVVVDGVGDTKGLVEIFSQFVN